MAGETTYDHMMLCRGLSSLFTQADLPSSLLPSTGSSPYFFFTSVYTPDLLFVQKDATTDAKNGPDVECLQLWRCECEEMGFTGMNLARGVRLRVQTNKMWGKNCSPAC